MKKKIACGLAVVMLLSALTGCGKSAKSQYLLDVDYSKYVKLCEYKGVEATKVVFEVTDDEIQEAIEDEMYDYVEYEAVTDRGVEVDDCVNVSYDVSVDGEVVEDYSGEEEDIIAGEGYLFEEVEEALLGMKAGEKKSVDVELTEDFANEEDIGKTAKVEFTVNEINIENLPEYTDAFVKENLGFDTKEAYEESLKKDLEESKESDYKYEAVDGIMTYIVDNSEFDGYPQKLYDQCKENYESSNEYYASMYGMELDEYMDMFGLDEETQKQDILDNVHYELVIGAIAQAENIDCTEKEIKEFIENTYEEYGYETADAFSADYSDSDIGYELVYEKVTDLLYDNAKYNEISEEDYLAEQEEEYYMDDDEVVDDEMILDDGEEIDVEEDDEMSIIDGSEEDELNVDIDDTTEEAE